MVEAMATIAPADLACMPGTAARMMRSMPLRLTSKVWSHSSSVILANGIRWAIPALATTTSSAPCRLVTSATTSFVREVSVTSRWKNSAIPPALRISSTSPAPSWLRISVAITAYPARAKAIAVARPMPIPLPVIRTLAIVILRVAVLRWQPAVRHGRGDINFAVRVEQRPVDLDGTPRRYPSLSDVIGDALGIAPQRVTEPAAAIRIGNHGLIAPDHDLLAGAERHDLSAIRPEVLPGWFRRMAAPDAERRVDGAVADETDLDVGTDGAEFGQNARRPAKGSGTFGIRDDAPRRNADRMMKLVDLDAVVERHPGIAHGEQGQPAIIAERSRSTARGENHFVDERCIALPRIAAGQHAGSRRNSGAAFGHAGSGIDFGEGALDRIGDPVSKIGCSDRCAGGVTRNADSAILAQLDIDSPKAAGIGRYRLRQAVEHADHGSGARAGVAQIDTDRDAIDVVGHVDIDPRRLVVDSHDCGCRDAAGRRSWQRIVRAGHAGAAGAHPPDDVDHAMLAEVEPMPCVRA